MALLNELITGARTERRTANFSVIMVHYSKLRPSEENKYSTGSIEELANMIRLSGGVKQNLLARKVTPDEYELIAGHRRRLAVKYLVEELGLEEYAMVPVHEEKEGDILSRIDLILTNCGARERSDWEKLMEVNELTETLKLMQTGSEKERERFRQVFGMEPGLGGRELRKLIAQTLGLSETNVANLNHINSSLSPELKERFRGGEIGISVANAAAGLPPEKQKELAEKEEIRLADVKPKAVSESDTGKRKHAVSESDTEEEREAQDFEVEGQLDFETDFPEVMPVNIVATSQEEEASEDMDVQMESESEKIQRFIRTWKKVCPSDFETACQAIRFNENNTERAKRIQKSLAPYGAHYMGNGEWGFDFHGFSGGMDWKIGTERLHLKYGSLASELFEMYGSCPEADVIEAEFTEVEPEPVKTFDRLILEELIHDTQGMLNLMQDYWKENQPQTYTKHVMMLHAYQMLQQANAEQEGERLSF